MNIKTKLWFKSLLAAVVTGIANAGGAALGIATANGVGLNVPQVDWKQLVIMSLIGGLIGMFSYLKQSPVPPSGNTESIEK